MNRCAVCGGRVQSAERIATEHRAVRYEFCSDEHRAEFEAMPEVFATGPP
ncbi:TRASH domain-containing protein [Halobacteriales archaeon QS_9_68_17]|nr:MAG: TRASH domain-containing protein [Halobacteriales archaeon QS_9_68_17]